MTQELPAALDSALFVSRNAQDSSHHTLLHFLLGGSLLPPDPSDELWQEAEDEHELGPRAVSLQSVAA
ncbi:MAG: hypothetical protein V4672_02215 [Verrucomicrobiota bacterium]